MLKRNSDWYKFTVQDNPGYTKVRFQLTPNTATGLIKFEVYKNLVTNANVYAMANVVSGDGGEKEFDPGDYYIRVVSTKDINTFTTDDIVSYQLTITPTAVPSEITITRLEDYKGNSIYVEYKEGSLFRIERDSYDNAFIKIYGRATYFSSAYGLRGAANVKIDGKLVNESMEDLGIINSTTYGSVITNEFGYFTMVIDVGKGIGHNAAINGGGFIHKYDIMDLTLTAYNHPDVTVKQKLYLYCYSL